MTGTNRDISRTDVLDALRQTREKASSAVKGAETSYAAFKIATELVAAFREAADDMAGIRAREAARIRKSEGLSLASLADRLGISKTRADQLMRIAKAQDAEQ